MNQEKFKVLLYLKKSTPDKSGKTPIMGRITYGKSMSQFGTSYADTVSITNDNLSTDDNGELWLKYRRKKNEMLARVKLLPEALELIEKYKSMERDTLFPMQHYATLRANMKGLRVMSGMKEDLVYHAGRHSFSSLITLEQGVPIETISRSSDIVTSKPLRFTPV